MYLSILFFPFLGSIFSGLLGRFFGPGVAYITTFGIFVSFFFSIWSFYEVAFLGNPCSIIILNWFESELFVANWSCFFDSLTVVMLLVVTTVSLLVHIYSTEYMSHDPHLPRFMSYLSFFTFFMLLLVSADNFIQLFVGWEGVGLCSYLLINFWYTRIQANKAAIKAMVVNRVGDFGLALGIFIAYISFNSVEYSTIFSLIYQNFNHETYFFLYHEFNLLFLICILLFIGSMGKSAQLGLHTWLPDAMEGPTPVSALIHAATMVTAGVFLLARCSPIFEYSSDALFLITGIGACTSFFAASTGLLQNDLKKVIAYSTCSQLGYMIFACGLSSYSVGIFHLSNHAFFKALLFLGAGSVIHAVSDEQDMRRMGGLKNLLPFTYSVMLIGSLALMGFPFLAGFYSKDVILETSFSNYRTIALFAYILGTLSAFLTAFYSVRLLYLTFLTKTNALICSLRDTHDTPIRMALPLFLLTLPSIFIGYIFKDCFIGVGSPFWNNAIFVFPFNSNLVEGEFINSFFKLLPVMVSLIGASTSFLLYKIFNKFLFKLKLHHTGLIFYKFFNRKWFFDKFYNTVLNQNLLNFSYNITYKNLDKGLIEFMGPFGLSKSVNKISNILSFIHTGIIYDYALILFGSLFLLLSLKYFVFLQVGKTFLFLLLLIFFII